MYTPLTIRFSAECWRYLHDASGPRLSAELRAVLDLSPRIRVVPPSPAPHYAVDMLGLQAQELLQALATALDALPGDDPRRRECQRCLDDLEEGVRAARRA